MIKLDGTSRKILDILSSNGRNSFSEIAKELKKPESTIRDKIKSMERRGIIKGYVAILDKHVLGFTSEALCFCNIPPENMSEIVKELLKIRNVRQISFISGDKRILLRVLAENNQALRQVIHEKIIPLGVTEVDSRIIMDEAERFPPEGLMPWVE